mgnify:CR=1 FL=1
MSQDMPPIIIAIALFFFAGTCSAMEKFVELDDSVYQFTQNYCIKCHGPEKQKGDRAFHQISKLVSGKQVVDLADDETVYLLHDLLDQLNLGEMPPKKEGVDQPKSDETKRVINWLTKTLLELEKQKGPKQTVLRRLNRREYHNTMRDLLGLKDLAFDFTENFPTDEKNHGFTNVGDALSLSDQHLNAYLEAADRYLRMAFASKKELLIRAKLSSQTNGDIPADKTKLHGCTEYTNPTNTLILPPAKNRYLIISIWVPFPITGTGEPRGFKPRVIIKS